MVGYRKLGAACIALALSTALLALKLIDGSNWVTFNSFQLGFFFGTNALGKFGSKNGTPS